MALSRDEGFALAFASALILFAYSRTESGAAAISSATETVGEAVNTVTDSITSAVRGIRNRNPGNIRKNATKWQGLAAEQNDPAFFQFASMAYGVRAIAKILQTYQEAYGLDTVRKIINRWAPASENDTGAYVSYVAGRMDVSADMPIDVNDEGTMYNLIRAIIAQENGAIPARFVTDSDVFAGIDLA